ncbi:MAG: ABC transporter permease [Spirochaetaceae bacterium]|jgi:lipoprotein-releasing system permease protein|nr:ABC transporter permease [Spirochaetaceae bacterium]
MKADFFIAFRYLLGRAGEGGRYLQGAAAGIALSLIPIIVTLIVADGMIRGITDRYLELGTGHLQVYSFADAEAPERIISAVAEEEGVRGVWAERRGLGLVIGGRGKTGATIRAVESSFWEDEGSGKYLAVIAGEAKLESDREVLLGQALAEAVGAQAGKNIRLMTIRSSNGGNIPKTAVFKVKGIISSGYREIDALWCIMSYEGGSDMLSAKNSSSSLIVKIDDPYRNAERIAGSLNYALGSKYGVYAWKELQPSLYGSYESTRQLLLFIMALIVLVAAVNVSSATSMLVLERRRDIAVLKTAGASPAGTSRIFLWGSCLTGLTGAISGIGVGLLIGNYINPLIHGVENILGFFSRIFNGEDVKILDPGFYLENIPIVIDWTAVFFIGLFTVICSIIASWIPARRAGKIKPIEILRKY